MRDYYSGMVCSTIPSYGENYRASVNGWLGRDFGAGTVVPNLIGAHGNFADPPRRDTPRSVPADPGAKV